MNLKKKEKMKENIKFIYLLSLQITIVFLIAMFSTYFGELLSNINFFGDKPCPDRYCGGIWGDHSIDWGTRHYWYAWLCFTLFCLSIARTVIWAINYWEEK